MPCLPRPREIILSGRWFLSCASAQAYTSSMTKTSEWSLMPAKRCPPECKYSYCEKALLCTVWAIQCFSNYIGAQKVIIETCHQPVTFLNSQRIRDGVVTNARIATWLMTLQGRDVEARYAQNYNPHLETGLRPAKTVQRTRCTPQQNRKNATTTANDKSQVLRGECV